MKQRHPAGTKESISLRRDESGLACLLKVIQSRLGYLVQSPLGSSFKVIYAVRAMLTKFTRST